MTDRPWPTRPVITEQQWLGNIPASHTPQRRSYLMPLPQPFPLDLFALPGELPEAQPPITVTVTEEVTAKYGPRKPVIHWEDVPAFSENAALQEIIEQAIKLRAAGIEPVFTINGEVVNLAGNIFNPHL